LKIKEVVMRRRAILFSLSFALLLMISAVVLALDEEAVCNDAGGEWESGIYRCTLAQFEQNGSDIEYSYQVRYPTRIASEPFIQTAVTDYLQTVIDEFMAGVDATTDVPGGGSLYLETNFEIFHYNDDISSVLFYTSTYLGGAHPLLFIHSMTFNTATDEQLELADLFTPGADYITPIQAAVRADLSEQLGPDMSDFIESGTADDPALYQNFAITDDSLIFFFSQGDVAPSVAGARSARVPLSDLTDIWALEPIASDTAA
jgi:hypothetical protein